MRLNFTLFTLLLLSFTASAQKVTGIWRGYFSSSNGIYREGAREETYKYEIQIDQQSNNGIKGVTYSYKTTVFYGKAELSGIYTAASKSIIIKETRLVDLKISDKSEPCLMTCYLDYSKIGKMEVLEGTFISINAKDKGDCGSGRVYLERVTTSDFKKEDFLLKKKPADTSKVMAKPVIPATTNKAKSIIPPPVANGKNGKDNLLVKPLTQKPAAQKPIVPQGKNTTPPKVVPPTVKKIEPKPNSTKPKIGNKNEAPVIANREPEKLQQEPVKPKKEEAASMPQTEPQMRKMPIPKVLVERENNLVRTITTSEEFIQVDLYDNGTIDNDTISVYHNNELVVSSKRLSYTPLTVKIKCSKTDNRHELTVVADNLGDIPPNTALMVIKTGNQKERYEIFLTSNEQRNAKVVINYVPKE